jgi:hypothetical protein
MGQHRPSRDKEEGRRTNRETDDEVPDEKGRQDLAWREPERYHTSSLLHGADVETVAV